MIRALQSPARYWALGVSVVYLALLVVVSQFYETIPLIPMYASQIRWGEFITSLVLIAITAALVGVVSVSLYTKVNEKVTESMSRSSVASPVIASCAATLGGLATGVCPACVTGIFPIVLGFFGVTFSWASLPFHGVEVQALVVIVLALTLFALSRGETESL